MADITPLLAIPGSVNFIEGVEITGFVLDTAGYASKFSFFKDVEVTSFIEFRGVDFSLGISFEKCKFSGGLKILSCIANGYDEKVHPHSQSVIFKGCVFADMVLVGGEKSTFDRTLIFEDCVFEKGLYLDGIEILAEGITIRNCTINGGCDISHIESRQDLSFSGNTINSFVRLEKCGCNTLVFVGKNVVSEHLLVQGCVFTRGIVFNEGNFKKEVNLSLIQTQDSGLSLIGSDFESTFFVDFHAKGVEPLTGIASFFISDAKFRNGIYVRGTRDPFSTYPIVQSVRLDISAELKGDIHFGNLDLGLLDISGFNSAANLTFMHCRINRVRITEFINNAGFILSGIKASLSEWLDKKDPNTPLDSRFDVQDSNLGKAQFFQIDFSWFVSVSIHNVILTDISTSLVKWFSPEQFRTSFTAAATTMFNEAKESKDPRRIANTRSTFLSTIRSNGEVYRQLKLAAQRQSDAPLSLEFQRQEMQLYSEYVKASKPRNWNEYLILWASQSNSFGQSWLKATVLLLAFSLAAYIPIGFLASDSLDYTRWASSWSDVAANLRVVFWDNLKYWLVLFNPTHRLKEINENIEAYSSWIYFWDFLSRVVVSYFLFQIISAFRKFNK